MTATPIMEREAFGTLERLSLDHGGDAEVWLHPRTFGQKVWPMWRCTFSDGAVYDVDDDGHARILRSAS